MIASLSNKRIDSDLTTFKLKCMFHTQGDAYSLRQQGEYYVTSSVTVKSMPAHAKAEM